MTKVLIVDDNPAYRDSLRSFLGLCGWEVAVAANGAEAVQRAADFRPDVLVIDWLLSDRVDGFELVRSLRASGLAAPAIVISGYPSSRNGAPTNGLTGVRFLTKPFPPKVLLEAIEAAAAEGRV